MSNRESLIAIYIHAVEEKSSTQKVAPGQPTQTSERASTRTQHVCLDTNTFKVTQKILLLCLQYCLDEKRTL